jgi:hypothetical protein
LLGLELFYTTAEVPEQYLQLKVQLGIGETYQSGLAAIGVFNSCTMTCAAACIGMGNDPSTAL